HVVGHDVEHLAEAGFGQPPGQPVVGGRAAEFGVQVLVVDHVVAVRAALGGLQVRRAVQVADPEAGQRAGGGGGGRAGAAVAGGGGGGGRPARRGAAPPALYPFYSGKHKIAY